MMIPYSEKQQKAANDDLVKAFLHGHLHEFENALVQGAQFHILEPERKRNSTNFNLARCKRIDSQLRKVFKAVNEQRLGEVHISSICENIHYLFGARNEEGDTLLHIACRLGSVKDIRVLVGKGAEASENHENLTPLQVAAKSKTLLPILREYFIGKYGLALWLRKLEKYQATAQQATKEFDEIIDYCRSLNDKYGQHEIEQLRNSFNFTTDPLVVAFANSNLDEMKKLLEEGGNCEDLSIIASIPKILDNIDWDCQKLFREAQSFFEGAHNKNVYSLERTLHDFNKQPCLLNARNRDGDTVLHIACRLGWEQGIVYLVDKGAKALENNKGLTPLQVAADAGTLLDVIRPYLINKYRLALWLDNEEYDHPKQQKQFELDQLIGYCELEGEPKFDQDFIQALCNAVNMTDEDLLTYIRERQICTLEQMDVSHWGKINRENIQILLSGKITTAVGSHGEHVFVFPSTLANSQNLSRVLLGNAFASLCWRKDKSLLSKIGVTSLQEIEFARNFDTLKQSGCVSTCIKLSTNENEKLRTRYVELREQMKLAMLYPPSFADIRNPDDYSNFGCADRQIHDLKRILFQNMWYREEIAKYQQYLSEQNEENVKHNKTAAFLSGAKSDDVSFMLDMLSFDENCYKQKGANPTALMVAEENRAYNAMRQILMRFPQQAYAVDGYNRNVLARAVIGGRIESVRYLLTEWQKNPKVHQVDPNIFQDDNSPLLLAIEHNQQEIFDLLLEAGANVNFKYSDSKYTALDKTYEFNRPEMMAKLLSAGAMWNLIDITQLVQEKHNDCTTILVAAQEYFSLAWQKETQDINVVTGKISKPKDKLIRLEALLKIYPFLLNMRDKDGNTQLHKACAKGWVEGVRLLLEMRAAIVTNHYELTPLEQAGKWLQSWKERKSLLKLIQTYFAKKYCVALASKEKSYEEVLAEAKTEFDNFSTSCKKLVASYSETPIYNSKDLLEFREAFDKALVELANLNDAIDTQNVEQNQDDLKVSNSMIFSAVINGENDEYVYIDVNDVDEEKDKLFSFQHKY